MRRWGPEAAILRGLLIPLGAVMTGLSCTSGASDPATPPESPSALRFQVDAGRDFDAGEGDEITLSAVGRNGVVPYSFRWSIERRPEGAEGVSLSSDIGAEVHTSAVTVQGQYMFRVLITDKASQDAYDWVTVTVGPPGTGVVEPIEVQIQGPDALEPGQSASLQAIVNGSTNGLSYLWESVTDSEVTFDTPDQSRTTFTANEPGTVVVRVTVADEDSNAAGSAELSIQVGVEGALAVEVDGPDSAEVNQPFEITATTTNGMGDLTFSWSVTDGEALLTNDKEPIVSVQPTAEGRLAVTVEVTDAATDQSAAAEFVITVDAAINPLTVRPAGPDILRTGEPGALSVEIDGEDSLSDIVHRWLVVSGDATLDDESSATPNLISSNGETVQVRVTVTATDESGGRSGAADLFVVTFEEDRPEVVFTIPEFGEFVFELRPDVSPKTTANFLRYVDDRFYDGIAIHRVVEDFVVQAGGFTVDDEGELEPVEPRDPVEGEAPNGLSNIRGTVAMALSGGNPDSGTSQWFVNLVDNTADGDVDLDIQNFTVFASVSEGMDVIDDIAQVEVETRSGLENVPVDDIIIESARRRDPTP